MERKSKDRYYLDIAYEVASRGTCLRRNYGCVIVKNDEIIATGYSGAPRGMPNCIDTGICIRQEYNIPSRTRYELCYSVHSEQNALISAARKDLIDSMVYISGIENGELAKNCIPCDICMKMLINAGIKEVIVPCVCDVGIFKMDIESMKRILQHNINTKIREFKNKHENLQSYKL